MTKRRLSLGLMAVLAALLASPAAQAQELEPRDCSKAPVGLNFLVAAYGYSEGGLATDPSVPIEDAQLRIHTIAVACARSLAFYSVNDDWYGGNTLEHDPICSARTNLSYNFGRGIWAALGPTFYRGGRPTVRGVRKEDSPSNSRAGLTVTLPLSRHNALKFNPSRGLSTRTGTSFTTYGIACQYRWGKGFQDPLPGSGCLPLNRPVPDSSG